MSSGAAPAGNAIPLAEPQADQDKATTDGISAAANGSASQDEQAQYAMRIQQKYAEERAKRTREDGTAQFIDISKSDKFKYFQEDIWLKENDPTEGPQPLQDGSRCKYLIVGAGFGGVLYAVKLIKTGVDPSEIRIVDSAGGFGGTWYWNRYPGLMCDVEAYCYLPMLEEMGYMPKHKYSYGDEIRTYCNMIVEKYGLASTATFCVETHDLKWNDQASEWVAKMTQKKTDGSKVDMTVRAEFAFMCSGLLNVPKLPGVPGIEDFKGHSFHTSRWDYEYTGGSQTDPTLSKLKDRRVAVVGTGATAVQALPHLAKYAKELYVVQRTPSSCDERGQRETDASWWKEMTSKKGWQKERQENFNACVTDAPRETNMVNDGWTSAPQYCALIGGPHGVTMENVVQHVTKLHAMDIPRAEKIRARVDEIVKDKDTAQRLKHWYATWCKRPTFHDDYLHVYNQPNVHLVDTEGKSMDKVTEKGFVVRDREYLVDVIIYSTGFKTPLEGSPDIRAGMTCIGRDGITMTEKWTDDIGTLHGVVSRDFPNLFIPGPVQGAATANQMYMLDVFSDHSAHMIKEAHKKAGGSDKKVIIEPTAEAVEEWGMRIMMGATMFAALAGCTPSYLNGEGAMDRLTDPQAQMKAAKGAIWGNGVADYVNVIEQWRNEGQLRGLEVKPVA